MIYKYKVQLMTLLGMTLLTSHVFLNFPMAYAVDYSDIIIETGAALSCLYLMFRITALRNYKGAYRAFLLASSLMFIGKVLDILDEFVLEPTLLDMIEETVSAIGFLLLLSGSFKWVKIHKEQSDAMRLLADTDHLTGLLNRRAFAREGELLAQNNSQTDTEVSVIVFDVDHFKKVNDTYGHVFGDKILIEIADKVKSTLRKDDCLARLGGEEFAVLLKNTCSHEAASVAEKIRRCVEGIRVQYEQEEVTCSISLGLASALVSEDVLERLTILADNALYEAKAQGRNCLRIAN